LLSFSVSGIVPQTHYNNRHIDGSPSTNTHAPDYHPAYSCLKNESDDLSQSLPDTVKEEKCSGMIASDKMIWLYNFILKEKSTIVKKKLP